LELIPIIFLVFIFFFILPQLMILNGLRYLKYKNIIGITGTLLETLTPNKETKGEKYRGYAKSFITFGIIFNIVLYSFLLFVATQGYQWLIIIILPLLIATLYFFYWYWHTKEDPLGDFEYLIEV